MSKAVSPSSPSPSPPALTIDDVRHVAKLSRLNLSEAELERCREQLAAVLAYVEKLNQLDVTGIEPMGHPTDVTNRLAEDVPAPSMPLEALLSNAPAVEDRYLAVPKVLAESAGG